MLRNWLLSTCGKNQKLLLGLGVGSQYSGVGRQESGELRINNKRLNALFTDFRQFNPYFVRS
ncbi:hypothetical protein [Microcystis aeruginosa]|uniref:hypothetical protein n=1 Tax=Microcystis aeruginosa TaxID=1126 RepID=UPI0015629727|nr:hypothetical protein [Microcystis aeruginosa]